MMRHQLWISVLLIAAFGAPVAMADLIDLTTYTINFTGTGTLPTAGMFTYDPDTTTFTSFLVTWHGVSFDLTSSANAPLVALSFPLPCLSGLSGAAASFALLQGACPSGPVGSVVVTEWDAVDNPPFNPFFDFLTTNGPAEIQVLAFPQQIVQPFTDQGVGGWSISPKGAAVAEPSSLTLVTTLLCAFVARRRISNGLRQATRTNR